MAVGIVAMTDNKDNTDFIVSFIDKTILYRYVYLIINTNYKKRLMTTGMNVYEESF